MSRQEVKQIFFAGGGTGGHLYPALAVAEWLQEQGPRVEIAFFCSSREIDAKILGPSGFDFLPLPAEGFSKSPLKMVRFLAQFLKSYYFAKEILRYDPSSSVVVGTGGFVSAPVVAAAHSLHIPVFLINVDSVPGKANRLMARYASRILVQFEQTRPYFGRFADRVEVVGCPLRKEFNKPVGDIRSQYGLDAKKKILLITGASSGSRSINQAILEILPSLEPFAEHWQIVHLTGTAHFEWVRSQTAGLAFDYHVLDYCHQMPALLRTSSLVIGRAGAVSVAEYAAAGVPAICLPYPYHKDRHQFLNAQPLVERGAAVIVEDNPAHPADTTQALQQVLFELMGDSGRLEKMAEAARSRSGLNASERIARLLLGL